MTGVHEFTGPMNSCSERNEPWVVKEISHPRVSILFFDGSWGCLGFCMAAAFQRWFIRPWVLESCIQNGFGLGVFSRLETSFL